MRIENMESVTKFLNRTTYRHILSQDTKKQSHELNCLQEGSQPVNFFNTCFDLYISQTKVEADEHRIQHQTNNKQQLQIPLKRTT